MATSLTSVSVSFPAPAGFRVESGQGRRRRITPQAGRAIEILGHAIEYLTDEFVQSGAAMSAKNADLEAVQLLMGLNRQVYFECPVAPTMGERLRSVLRPHTA